MIETKTVTDVENGMTYILNKETNEIITSRDFYGNIYNSEGVKVGTIEI